ncbi:MAG: hypothetical protein IJK84_06465 [Bacteroidales bacterium]|nr:hypothetical protein [Bacteroidales bacterium]
MKKILFIILMLVVCGGIHAQSTSFSDFSEGVGTSRGIVRDQGISYYEKDGRGYFLYLSSFSGSINQVKIPVKWSVRDFRVVDDIAYFCGVDSNYGRALLGYFDVSDLQTGAGNIIFYYDTVITTRLTVLSRIAVSNKGKVSLMAIGSERMGCDPDLDGANRVLYVEDYASNKGTIFDPSSPELFWDVVLTNDNFVTTGTRGRATNELLMRKLQVGTGLSAFVGQFGGYRYTCSNEFVSGVRAAHVKDESVVVAAYFDSTSFFNTPENWMHLFTINMQDGSMDAHQSLITSISVPYYGRRMLPPRELVFLPSYDTLMVIDTNSDTRNKKHILRLTPYPNVAVGGFYMPFRYNNPNCLVDYYSLTAVAPNSCMVSAGAFWLRLELGLLPSPMYTNGCVEAYTTDCFREAPHMPIPFVGGSVNDDIMAMKAESCMLDSLVVRSCTPGSYETIFNLEYKDNVIIK